MTIDRRSLLSAAGLATAMAGAGSLAVIGATSAAAASRSISAGTSGGTVLPNAPHDQTEALQALIDHAADNGYEIVLPPGRFRSRALKLRRGTRISGSADATVLELTEGATLFHGVAADGVGLVQLSLDGGHHAPRANVRAGLIALESSRNITLARLDVRSAGGHGVFLDRCSGCVSACRIAFAADAGLHAVDSTGLTITLNDVSDCGNNGIQVWRSEAGEDGTQVIANRIARIGAVRGGTGQNGNGVNIYRAAGVMVTDNRITDCAYSAVRGNAASNLQIVANNCARLGEVALYAEFGFEGALITANIVDTAATGISVTNFDVGGRLAVVQGNLLRNLVRREHEPVDKRGEGIAIEADATVTGNMIDNAATAGIVIGWGRHMRDCMASGNVIRGARIGIMISSDPAAGAAFVTANMISGARDGAIRAMSLGTPHGPDLAVAPPTAGRVTITGNVAA